MLTLEAACVAIVAVYFIAHRDDPERRRDALILALAAWVGEDTVIRAYGFYAYAPGWHLQLDRVPVLIPAIWAPVVLSARSVARALAPGASAPREALLVGALVTFDASLIEPIAVRAGLWSWTQPGVFTVPVIGILGWGLFAFAAVWLLRALRGAARWSTVALAPLATHAMLLAVWWSALRRVWRAELDWRACAAVVGASSAVYTLAAWRTGARLPWRELGPRAAATAFFAALLVPRMDLPLGVWAALFTAPWMVFCARAARGVR